MRRFLRWLLVIFGVLGLVHCVAGLIACWQLRAEALPRLDALFTRADELLTDVGGDVSRVRDSLRQVQTDLDATRRSPGRPAMAAVARRLGDTRPKLSRAVELGMVANGVLDSLSDLSLADRAGINTDRLRGTSEQLDQAVKLAADVGGAVPPEEASRIADAVGRAVAVLDEAAERVGALKDRIAIRRMEIPQQVTYAAIIATVALIWIAVGQVCMIVVGRRRTATPVS
jgi:hypothetical protein